MKEVWKNIDGYLDYMVSNYGNVKSMKFNKERILKPVNNKGYLHIILSVNNIKRWKYIHRLVAKSFISNDFQKHEINHIDGNKQNNNVNNLEWCTRSENEKHAYNTGLLNLKSIQGENSIYHKLSENEVLAIHGLNLNGMKQKTITKIYKIKQPTVSNIVNGKIWKHLIK